MSTRSTFSADDTIYLDMIGGIAGDMFLAALCDLDSGLGDLCDETLGSIADLPQDLRIEYCGPDTSGALGATFKVWREENQPDDHPHAHMSYREVRRILDESDLSPTVRARANDIFKDLARCESKVHGVSVDDVVFHEVGGWDSIVDVVLAAALIDAVSSCTWIAGSVPLGSGSIRCAHGLIPVPAPATTELLRGFVVHKDEFEGERVTPTGAAILRHIQPRQVSVIPNSKLLAFGSGYGSKHIEGLSNVLRCYRLSQQPPSDTDAIAIIECDIDDQSPEDLALGIDFIRTVDGVLDVVQTSFVGKKNRLGSTVRIMAIADAVDDVADACLAATSTLGIRWYLASRRTLSRNAESRLAGTREVLVKATSRPDGHVTAKIESDELTDLGQSFGERELLRAEISSRDTKCED